MFKKLLIYLQFFIIAGLLATSGVLGYFFYQADEENKDLSEELVQARDGIDSEECPAVEGGECVHKLADEGLGFEFTYPSDWEGYTDSEWSDETVYPAEVDDFGVLLSEYEVNFEKDDVVLNFSTLLGPVDAYPEGLYDESHDFVQLDEEVVRWKLSDDTTWTYSSITECTDGGEIFEDVSDAELCYLTFFPSFIDGGWAIQATVDDASEELLSEADAIAISVL